MYQMKDIRRALRDRNLSHVARETEIPRQTLSAIRAGEQTGMHLHTWQTLVKYLEDTNFRDSEAT